MYNNSYNPSIGISLLEGIYDRRCRSPTGWFQGSNVALIGPRLLHEAMEKVLHVRK